MTILEMSAGGSLLIAVILLLRRAALFRLPKWSFLLLWAAALCRLLIPFSVPSQFSVYNGAAWFSQAAEQEEAPGGPFEPSGTVRAPAPPPPAAGPEPSTNDTWTPPAAARPERSPVSPLAAVYLAGSTLCGLFFAAAYGAGFRRFRGPGPQTRPFSASGGRSIPLSCRCVSKSAGRSAPPWPAAC